MENAGITELIARVPYRAGGHSVPDRVLFSVKEERTPQVFDFLASELLPPIHIALRERGIIGEDAILTALPRRGSAIRKHGFDEALELCRALSALSGLPYERILYRRGFTAEEKTLSRDEREQNSRRAFYTRALPDALRGKTVFLVDDLVTTGSGLSVGAELLYALGADDVVAVVIGRTESLLTVRETREWRRLVGFSPDMPMGKRKHCFQRRTRYAINDL
jgi:predicted amidophosphoribosyltransferase